MSREQPVEPAPDHLRVEQFDEFIASANRGFTAQTSAYTVAWLTWQAAVAACAPIEVLVPRPEPSNALVHQTESNATAMQRPVGRRVVCAALRASDGRVLLGIRHYSKDMHEQIARRDDRLRFEHLHDPDQGFVDQFGVYMTREEAYQVAAVAGQIVRPEACGAELDGPKLYSEGLY